MAATEDMSTRLRAARNHYGLSQRRLARQSGVSNATISLIEKGSLNPTISTLFKLLAAFPMTITAFW
jgi:transcriptional regulator with XRE-family HTH domain